MKNAFVVLAIAGGALAGALGCNPTPATITRVDQSTLPPAARNLIAPDSKITDVRLAQYAKGETDYVIDYTTAEGANKQIVYGDYHQTQPTNVFQRFEMPKVTR